MNDLNVPAEQAERELERAAAKLDRGDWILVIDEEGQERGGAQVLHVEPYENQHHRRVVVMYRKGNGEPASIDVAADSEMLLLTDAEIADLADQCRREQIARQFFQLVNLVRDQATPLPKVWRAITVTFDFGEDAEALAAFGEAIEVKPINAYGRNMTALRSGSDDYSAGVDVIGQGVRAEYEEPAKPLFAEGEPKCGAHTPTGPCVLFPGHAELCSPEPVSEL